MIEKPKVITGTPKSVEKSLAHYLASHPSAAVLSSAVTVSPGQSDKFPPVTTVCVIAGLKL